MPRLSAYKPIKTNDFKFFNNTIRQMYQVGGLEVFCHKYLGPQVGNAGTPDVTIPVYDRENPLFIEDLLLLENRDRNYDPDIFILRMCYLERDVDFDLTQFGLFLNGDTLFLTTLDSDMIDIFGRRLMTGDVLEFPNLRDYNPLNTSITKALPRYYVIQECAWAAEGFSQTWLPHLWRIKATPMVNSQEYKSILDKPFEPDNIWDPGNFYPAGTIVNDGDKYYKAKQNVPPGTPIGDPNYWELIENPTTIGDVDSTRRNDLALNDAIVAQAHIEVPLSGFNATKFYILPTYFDNEPAPPYTGDGMETNNPYNFKPYMGYLTGDGGAPNGLPVTPGVSFPVSPTNGQYCLRLDYFPNRLFRYGDNRWTMIQENVRTDLYQINGDQTQRSSFVNNTYTTPTNTQGNIPGRQSVSQALQPDAINGNDGGHKTANPWPPQQPGQPTSVWYPPPPDVDAQPSDGPNG